MARKPFTGTVCANVEQYGTGAINVDGCRIAFIDDRPKETSNQNIRNNAYKSDNSDRERDTTYTPNDAGRFPANCIATDDDAWYSKYFNVTPQDISKKASKKDRNSDWQGNEIDYESEQPVRFVSTNESGQMFPSKVSGNESHKVKGNYHPTVKPVDLMAWLVTLVTPPGGVVLDPFTGSGSTLVAAKRLGIDYIGIELAEEYIEIANRRIE
jgi:site-specific DNA-methyltransferase (adenine-specific)